MSKQVRAPQKLTSWKEIAEYLQVAVRTAQTWEHEKGLPVNRMPGKKGRVNADPNELDHWKQSVYRRCYWVIKSRYFRAYAMLLAALLIAGAAFESINFLRQARAHSSAPTRIEQQPLVVVDHSKNEISGKTISKTDQTNAQPHTNLELERMITFQDVDDDGELETILHYSPVNFDPDPNASHDANEKKEQGQSIAAAPPPGSESSIPREP